MTQIGGSDRLGCDGLGCGDEEELRVGSRFSEGRLGYSVDSRKSANIGWITVHRVAARKVSGSALLARMIFDKDNPADRHKANGGGEQEGKMIQVTPG